MSEFKRNLRNYYHIASDEQKESIAWYPIALAECKAISERYQIDLVRIVYSVAALSPRLQWEVNIQGVIDIIETGWTTYGFGANRRKVIRILDGELSALSGPKVTSFAYNILNAHNPNDNKVTVDQWAMRAYYDDIREMNGAQGDEYDRISQDYRDVAAEFGLKPSEFQAIVWVVVKEYGKYVFAQNRSKKSK